MNTDQPQIATRKLVMGLVLISLGVSAFLGAIDAIHFRTVWKLWPLALIAFGVASEAEAFRNRRSDGGWVLIAIGTWFLIGNYRLMGLSHGNAMPLGIAIAGAFLVAHALSDRPKAPAQQLPPQQVLPYVPEPVPQQQVPQPHVPQQPQQQQKENGQ